MGIRDLGTKILGMVPTLVAALGAMATEVNIKEHDSLTCLLGRASTSTKEKDPYWVCFGHRFDNIIHYAQCMY